MHRIKQFVFLALIAAALALLACALPSHVVRGLGTIGARASLTLLPSAERAFGYGFERFDARHPELYDVDAAEWFYERAAELDPALPYVHHELSRIAFLRGDFETAMDHINTQIGLFGNDAPNSFYVRGLIEGYRGEYEASLEDYEYFLSFEPNNWAALNDYAWVLLKAGKPREAVVATAHGLSLFPDNPWLLNTNATGLYDLGYYGPARAQMAKTLRAVSGVTEYQWLTAYPGNDPKVAAEGVRTFQEAVIRNMHTFRLAESKDGVQ